MSATTAYRVLVIDDEPAMGRMIRRYLEPNHHVEFEQDPSTALSRLLDGERFDVILCDVVMPQLSGLALLGELKRAVPAQAERLVFMTGGARNSTALTVLETLPNRRIDKPFTLRELELELALATRPILESASRGA